MERAEQKTEQNVIYFLFFSQPSTQPAIPICLISSLVQTYIVRVVSYFFQEMKQKCFTSKAPLKSWGWSCMLVFFLGRTIVWRTIRGFAAFFTQEQRLHG